MGLGDLKPSPRLQASQCGGQAQLGPAQPFFLRLGIEPWSLWAMEPKIRNWSEPRHSADVLSGTDKRFASWFSYFFGGEIGFDRTE